MLAKCGVNMEKVSPISLSIFSNDGLFLAADILVMLFFRLLFVA
jgi:hypothetical protein